MTPHEGSDLDPEYDAADFLLPDSDADLTTCDREPIHLSGAIQPHGVLLAVREVDLAIQQVSANAGAHLGIEAVDLVNSTLTDALGGETTERLFEALNDPRASGADPLTCHLPNGGAYELTWHRIDRLVIVELEPAAVVGAVSMTVLFSDVRHAMQALQGTRGVQALCDAAASETKHLTGYDRVMVYRFHPDDHGEVVAEACEPDMEPFMGLHYPASDIPRQARKLFLLNRLRVIAEVSGVPVDLVGLADPDARPLNLSLSGLRSVSPIHLADLTNMGVQASLTISLMHGTRLWGMLACHHRTPKRIDAQMRAACRVLGQVFSLQVVAHEDLERQAYRTRLAEIEGQLVARMSRAGSLAGALVAENPSPLLLTAADGMVARIDGQTVTDGVVPPADAVEILLAALRADELPAALVTDELSHRLPELAPYAEHAAGVIALPLSGGFEDFVLWFRGEMVHSLNWAGNPDKPMIGDPVYPTGDHPFAQLGPRQSFAA
jgi:chemotaxis family two-component system sensor kinase Cph1